MTIQWLIYLNFLIDNNTKFYFQKSKTKMLFEAFCNDLQWIIILSNHLKCPYLSILDLKWFKHAMQRNKHGKTKHAVFVLVYQILILNFCLSSRLHTTYFRSVV